MINQRASYALEDAVVGFTSRYDAARNIMMMIRRRCYDVITLHTDDTAVAAFILRLMRAYR